MLHCRIDSKQAQKQPDNRQRLFLDYVEAELHARDGLYFCTIESLTRKLIYCLQQLTPFRLNRRARIATYAFGRKLNFVK